MAADLLGGRAGLKSRAPATAPATAAAAAAAAAAKKYLEGCLDTLRKNSGAVDPDAVVKDQEWDDETPELIAARLVRTAELQKEREENSEKLRLIDVANKAVRLAQDEAATLAHIDPVEVELLQFMNETRQTDRDAARKMLKRRKASEATS